MLSIPLSFHQLAYCLVRFQVSKMIDAYVDLINILYLQQGMESTLLVFFLKVHNYSTYNVV